MFHLPRSRTSSFTSLNPSFNPSDAMLRAFSVPPPNAGNNGGIYTRPTQGSGGGGKHTACGPCKKLGKICRSGKRPCITCVTSGKYQECAKESQDDDLSMSRLKLIDGNDIKTKRLSLSPKRALEKPIFDDQPMFPPSSDPPPLRNRFGYQFPIHMDKPLTYPPLGSLEPLVKMHTSPTSTKLNPVYLVLDFDFHIGRASRDCLAMFGSHPHEMLSQPFSMHLPITERACWKTLTKALLSEIKLPETFLDIPAIELSRLTWDQLRVPVEGVRSVGKQLQIRRRTGDTIPVQIVIWFGSCYGATASDYSTFKQAIILAKITPLNASSSPHSTRIKPTHPSSGLSSLASSLPAPRKRNISLSHGSGFGPLPPLPPPSMRIGDYAGLPPLPPIGFGGPLSSLPPLPPAPSSLPPPRNRRPSSGSLPPMFDDLPGPDFGLPPITRRRAPSFSGGRGRASTFEPLPSYPSGSYDKLMDLPPLPPLIRPASRTR